MRVAVIGHGPSPTGRGWGKKIDACDAVIRMWECGWQKPEDYGTRYDYGVFNLAATADGRRAIESVRDQPQPRCEWWLYRAGACRLPLGLFDVPARDLPRDILIRKLAELGARTTREGKPATPTRGLAAIAMARRTWPNAAIILVGFDGVLSGEISHTPYARDFVAGLPQWIDYSHDGCRDRAHDLSAEREWVATKANAVDAGMIW